MAKLLAFWGIKYAYCKIIAVVKSTKGGGGGQKQDKTL
jgi:hypothetical protein